MYVAGGSTFVLLKAMKKVRNFKNLIKEKVIAGTSAGAYFACKYFYENDNKKLGKGLGILNFKITGHFRQKRQKPLRVLSQYKENLSIIILPEKKYVVIQNG